MPDGSNDGKTPCDRCKNHNRPCKIPPSRPSGRKPGSLGRYRGVEKALRKIQTELRKAKTSSSPDPQNLQGLMNLADGKEEILNFLFTRSSSQNQSACHASEETAPTSNLPSLNSTFQVESRPRALTISQSSNDHVSPHQSDEPISNPLGLVADACGEAGVLDQRSNAAWSSPVSNPDSINLLATSSADIDSHGLARHLLRRPGYVSLGLKLDRQCLEHGLDALLTQDRQICRYLDYFKQSDVNQDRDTGPDVDPVDLGLVSMEEAHYLFPIFFARLHPINGILDPMLHTPEFVRSRSALLFTWILAISAQFDHASGSISKRLRIHGEHLSKYVHANGYKSVEIAQGYYISLLSAVPANTMAEERSWLYTIYAFGVAAELGLDRRSRAVGYFNGIVGTNRPGPASSQRQVDGRTSSGARGNQSELLLGHRTEDSGYAERLARNRERTWLRILLWERAHSAARGRVSAFPETDLTLNIETWYLHPLADPNDKYTCAFILLRRHLAALHNELKRQAGFQHTSRHWVRELLDSTLQPWCNAWLESPDVPSTPAGRTSNTFLRYVYMHGRLWTLSFALHGHNNNTAQDVAAIKEDCFEAAVNCCEIAVHDLQEIGEPIYCMLAPTWAMISYAAVLALRLFPLLYGDSGWGEVELLALLSQVALQLERAGTTPSHRFGIAALLGQHLFMILRARANALKCVTEASQVRRSLPLDSTNFEARQGAQGHTDNQPEPQSFDPFLSTFDPFLTAPFFPREEDGAAEGFTEALWDWFGQGIGGVT
ncbi:uncharacterized protein Z518_05467 [Rhinocladiella mackenziei CBS 650.93]|uniref:Rhinocladiella mackenziei CBS 650.93 unplaced genomic scaffold supercont1.4, whole genome shotgun sequence n=1 Tax=Rhinocladiella mackenziei CBS 650.93 TaxID=1442369 RepID=A0A0D2FQY5_9EURO|nr:uncharacterized protein Z518_05467 [Rhinocladiella mackenziei CBS 650.93]KIX04597.1 hypothetical protein Z518_05467 [Rhinocladiella mackenziei CBS 650.93]